jgi:nucleoside-diphosphate-sugar epimerase
VSQGGTNQRPAKRRLLVTGGSGGLGRAFIPRFIEAGYEVQSVGLEPWAEAPCPHLVCDLCSVGEAIEVVRDRDAVLHLAAVHRESVRTPAITFHVNVVSTFNVFYAASLTGVDRVVWASSCHTGGGRWSRAHGPRALPLRESDDHETGDTYGLSKIAGEAIMQHVRAWNGVSLAALRYGYVYAPDEYELVRARWDDPEYWAHSLWNYVDARDAFEATRLALEADYRGAHVLYVTAADQSMNVRTRDLVAEYFPQAVVDPALPEYGTLMSLDRAHEVIGYVPRHSWREALT